MTSADVAPEIALAEEHDACGRHDEAVNALARATRRGDVEAATRLGKRLIAGDRAPLLPRDGIRFLLEAAQGGGGEAAARLGVLAAAGLDGKHDWPRAIGLMRIAAERGYAPARDQLRVLACENARTGSQAPSAADWRESAAAVDAASWAKPPAGRTLHQDPLIRVFASLVGRAARGWLIARSRGKLERARVYDPAGKVDIVDRTRTNTAAGFGLMEIDLVHLMVQTKMAAACGYPLSNFEAAAVLHYEVGEEITNHYDFVDPAAPNYAEEVRARGQRVITFLAYLNDDYGGGETDFPTLGVSHKGRAGTGLFFVNALPGDRPDTRMLHAGRPPTSGEKWIFSQFVRNRPVLELRSQ